MADEWDQWARALWSTDTNSDFWELMALLEKRWRNGRSPQPRDPKTGKWLKTKVGGHIPNVGIEDISGTVKAKRDATEPKLKPRRNRSDPEFADMSDDDVWRTLNSDIESATAMSIADADNGVAESPETAAAWARAERLEDEWRLREARKKARESMAKSRQAKKDAQWAEISQLMDDEGIDVYEATERVTGVPYEKQLQREALQRLHNDGHSGSFAQASKSRFWSLVLEDMQRAEDETRGRLNKSRFDPGEPGHREFARFGSEAGLWASRSVPQVKKYASEELLKWFDENRRITLQQVRDDLLNGGDGNPRGRGFREDWLQ